MDGKIKKTILLNSFSSVLQLGLNTVIILILYKIIIRELGLEIFGIWSLLNSIILTVQSTNLGLNGGIVKFIGNAYGEGDKDKISRIIHSAIILCVIIYALFIFLLYIFIVNKPQWIIKRDYIDIFLKVLPAMLISNYLYMISLSLQYSMDGLQKIYIRNIILTLASIINLILCSITIPRYKLEGLIWSNIVQYVFISSMFVFFLRSYIFREIKLDFALLKTIIGYSIKLQIISVAVIFFDPVIKYYLTTFSSPKFISYYEISSKIQNFAKSFIYAICNTITPSISYLQMNNRETINKIFNQAFENLSLVSFFLLSIAIIITPLLSLYWLGKVEFYVIIFSSILFLPNVIHSIVSVHQSVLYGLGEVKSLVQAHIVIMLINIIFGYLFGIMFSSIGVVISWSVALLSGSFIILNGVRKFIIYDQNIVDYLIKYKFILIYFLILFLANLYSILELINRNFLYILFLSFIEIILLIILMINYKVFNLIKTLVVNIR